VIDRLPPQNLDSEQAVLGSILIDRDANRVQEVSEISRGLTGLARELKVPALALSQLSRQPEMRESNEPRLSDLRESGAIEQDADLVLFLWRERDKPGDDAETDGEVVNLRLAKHRNGPTGEVKLWFKKSQTRFLSYAAERYAHCSAATVRPLAAIPAAGILA
jgi:replicative DNA helicase